MDAIVIGCGASGVAALRKLYDAGLKVMVLEAKDRIGGRIHSVPFGDAHVDLGATWCHGETDNKVYQLANPLGLLGKPMPVEVKYYWSNGQVSREAEEVANVLDQILDNVDKNNGRGIAETLRNAVKTNATLKKNPELTKAVLEFYEKNSHLGGEDDPRTGKSLRGIDEHHVCEGEFWQHWKGKGYKTVLDVLLNKHPDPSKAIPVEILLNKEVESINWGGAWVEVKCTDGSSYTAKCIIVTVSIAVLKSRHETLFNPRLPAEKVTAIKSLQFCVLGKIYVEFEKAWWNNFIKFPILWRDEDRSKFTKEEKWATEVYQIQSVDAQKNSLLFWLVGDGAREMERTNQEAVKRGVEKLLQVVFGERVTAIRNVVRSQWATDRHTGGAYSYRSVATEQDGGGAAILSEPLSNGGNLVCFAGEATSIHHHSDVHGAIEAGFREAERVIQFVKR